MLDPLQSFNNDLTVPQHNSDIDAQFDMLIHAYYDNRLHDEHTRTGGTEDVKYGYADGGLPLVLCHNCPNNSIYLLWGQVEKKDLLPGIKALFPRISRHLEGR